MKFPFSTITVCAVTCLLIACDRPEVESSDQGEAPQHLVDAPEGEVVVPSAEEVGKTPPRALIVEEDEEFADNNTQPQSDRQPPLAEEVDYDAYVNYDWYQKDVADERELEKQEAQGENKIQAALLGLLKAKLESDRHKKVEKERRDHLWEKRQRELEREWYEAKERERQAELLREQNRKIQAKRAFLKAERERKLKLARRQKGWQSREAAKIREEEARRGAVTCLLYTSPSPRDGLLSRMPSSA